MSVSSNTVILQGYGGGVWGFGPTPNGLKLLLLSSFIFFFKVLLSQAITFSSWHSWLMMYLHGAPFPLYHASFE